METDTPVLCIESSNRSFFQSLFGCLGTSYCLVFFFSFPRGTVTSPVGGKMAWCASCSRRRLSTCPRAKRFMMTALQTRGLRSHGVPVVDVPPWQSKLGLLQIQWGSLGLHRGHDMWAPHLNGPPTKASEDMESSPGQRIRTVLTTLYVRVYAHQHVPVCIPRLIPQPVQVLRPHRRAPSHPPLTL